MNNKYEQPKTISQSDATQIRNALIQNICINSSIANINNITLNKKESITWGQTRNFMYNNESLFIIGINEFQNKTMTRLQMTQFVVSVCHEIYGHGIQLRQIFHDNTRLSQVLSTNYYASQISDAYYLGEINANGEYNHINYIHQACEMAAQYVGIAKSFEFYADYFDKKTADLMICEYINDRISQNSEFIQYRNNKHYTSINDILEEFENTFSTCIHKHKIFDHNKVTSYENDIYTYMCHKNHWAKTPIEKCGNGVKQDQLMATIYFKAADPQEQKYLKQNISCFKQLNIQQIMTQIVNYIKDPNKLDLKQLIDHDLREDIRQIKMNHNDSPDDGPGI